MNNSTISNKPMFRRSACDTKTIASPLTSAEITEINKSAHVSSRRQTATAMFHLHGIGGGIYLRLPLRCGVRGAGGMWYTVPRKSGFGWFDLTNWGDNRVSDSQASIIVIEHLSQGGNICCVLKGAGCLLALTKQTLRQSGTTESGDE